MNDLDLSDGILYRENSRPEVYVIYGRAKFWIPNPDVFNAMGFSWSSVRVVPDGSLANISTIPIYYTLLREYSKPEVYVMIGGKKAWIPDPNTFAAMDFSWSSVRVVPDGSLKAIPSKFQIQLIVTFGDSIVWGQGLNQDQKFSSLVASAMENSYNGGSPVATEIYAHSGAKIGYNLTDADKDAEIKFGDTPTFGEVPTTFPTIVQQVESYPANKIDDVDLILLNGGINDVGLDMLLSPNVSLTELAQKTKEMCYDSMKKLLELTIQKFSNPKTLIVVTGYYRIVTPETNLDYLKLLVNAVVPLYIALPADLAIDAYKNKLVDNFGTFEQTANGYILGAVDEADPNGQRVFFAKPTFNDSNAIFAPNTFLFGISTSLQPEDPMSSIRSQQCEQAGDRAPPNCPFVSMGHPNTSGAASYAQAITSVLVKSCFKLLVHVQPYPIVFKAGSRTVTVSLTVSAEDSQTHAPVAGRVIMKEPLAGPGKDVASTNTPFTYKFENAVVKKPDGSIVVYTTGKVSAAGYDGVDIDFGFPSPE